MSSRVISRGKKPSRESKIVAEGVDDTVPKKMTKAQLTRHVKRLEEQRDVLNNCLPGGSVASYGKIREALSGGGNPSSYVLGSQGAGAFDPETTKLLDSLRTAEELCEYVRREVLEHGLEYVPGVGAVPKRAGDSRQSKRKEEKKKEVGSGTRSDETKGKWGKYNRLKLPIPEVTEKKCREKLEEYRFEETLYKNDSKEVKVACKDDECDYVVKIDTLTKPDFREQDVSAYLQDLVDPVDHLHVTPRLIDQWVCKKIGRTGQVFKHYTIVDRFEGNMANRLESRGYMDVSEIIKMFRLAILLGLAGIIHGDLKIDQFLWRSRDIVLGDFGFSGTVIEDTHLPPPKVGWATRTLGCPTGAIRTPTHLTDQKILWSAMCNLVQLEASCIMGEDVLTIKVGKSKKSIFKGVENVPYRDDFFCTAYAAVRDEFLTDHKDEDGFTLDWNDLIEPL